ncbi:MAG: tRNA (adenosine(37)-N6)-threonylcarbamoyltransferase complex dimerization subunit type 1 TsaB [Verrucomicrobiae bacterium]|nr:tRNA (adenosine(37)-N6)-threonylcarbamoyltransferase complex dimerization subunit type 1 TsaB [Verrucomicrobiae bacterium]
MKILALEFSSSRRSVALVDAVDGKPPKTVAAVCDHGGRSTKVFALITQALNESGLQREEISTIAVGLGPGSYHGVRIAIAIAEGWSLGRGVPLVGVSSVESLAHSLGTTWGKGRFVVVVDAQRGEFYRADYDVDAGAVREVTPLRLISSLELERCLNAGNPVFGPDLSDKYPAIREAFPDAAMVGILAAERRHEAFAGRLEPIYLRETAFAKTAPPRFG